VQKIGGPTGERLFLYGSIRVARNHQDGQELTNRPHLDLPQHNETVEVGHADVQYQQIRTELAEYGKNFARIRETDDFAIPSRSEQTLQYFGATLVIVDNQDFG
jgi:hypothetical protein